MCTLGGRYYDKAFDPLRTGLAGLVFLGTPHTTKTWRDNWGSLSLILRDFFRLSGHTLTEAEHESATVVNTSEKFEESASDIPILSVYETKETKIGDSLFRSKKILVSPSSYSLPS